MSEEQKKAHTPNQETVSQAAEDLTRSVTDLVGAMFDVGAAVAKTAAQATSAGRPVPEPAVAQGPLNLMVHYGLTAASNIVKTVLAASPTAFRTKTSEAPGAEPFAPAGPAVTAGSTLRIPLSIENPGAEAMKALEFRCLRVDSVEAAAGQKLGVANVRMEPAELTIAPRDFEKLTVYVDTTSGTAPGTYRAVIGVVDGKFETAVQFDVRAAAQE